MSDTASDPHTETLKHSSCQTHFYTSTKCRNHKCQHIILVTVLDSQKLPAVKQTLQNTRPARLISSWYKRQFNWVTEHQTRSPPSQNHYEANLTVCRGCCRPADSQERLQPEAAQQGADKISRPQKHVPPGEYETFRGRDSHRRCGETTQVKQKPRCEVILLHLRVFPRDEAPKHLQ